MSAMTEGIKGMFPGMSGAIRDKKESDSSGLAGMFQTLLAKIDQLIGRLDSSLAPKVAGGASGIFDSSQKGATPAGTSPGGSAYDYGQKMDALLRQNSVGPNISKSFGTDVGEGADVQNDPLTSLINSIFGGGGKAAGGAAGGAAKEGELGSKFLSAEGAGAAAETAGLSLAIPALIEGAKILTGFFDTIKGHLGDVGKAGVQAFTSERVEDVGQSAVSGVRSGLKAGSEMIGGPLGGPVLEMLVDKVTGPFLDLAEAGFKAVGFLRDFSSQLTQANFHFAEFSGSMAMVQANMNIQQIMLDIERGERRAGSAGLLANAQMNTERMLAPLEDGWANIKADVMTGFNDLFQSIFGDMLEGAPDFMEYVQEAARAFMFWVDWDKRERQKKEGATAHAEEVRRFAREFNRKRGR